LRRYEIIVRSRQIGLRKLREHILDNGIEPVGRNNVPKKRCSSDSVRAARRRIVNRMGRQQAAEVSAAESGNWNGRKHVPAGPQSNPFVIAKQEELVSFNRAAKRAGSTGDNAKKAFYLYRGCSRRWMNTAGDGRGSAGLDILWPILGDPDYDSALDDAAEALREVFGEGDDEQAALRDHCLQAIERVR